MKRATGRRDRRGTATVELAVCLPVLAAIIFGTIEACSMIYVYQSLEITSYEAVRMAVRQEAYNRQPGQPNVMTNSQVISHAERILQERGIVAGTVDVSTDVASLQRGDMVTVAIRATAGSNSMLPLWFWDDTQLEARGTMVKE